MHPDPSQLHTIEDWRQAQRDGAAPRALIEARLARLDREGPAAAWILRLPAAAVAERLDALEQAAAGLTVAERLARWPLFGLPFAVKDNLDVAGWPTTAACTALREPALATARAVQALLDAGAVLLGKTNLDQFATGLVGTRSPWGAPASVLAADRISGGSSSGSAVLVGAGLLPFALGTDTAGSGRVPAGFNQIVGLKPTPGRVSNAGMLPACRTLDCVSIFALTVEDAAELLACIEGSDPGDAYSDFRPGLPSWPGPLRLGVPRLPDLDGELGYDAAWAAACARAEALGATLVPLDFEPLHATARLLYDGPWVAERQAAVGALLDAAPEVFDPTVAAVIGRARGQTAADAFKGLYALRGQRARLAGLWTEVDALMVPTAPTHPRFDAVAADPIGVNSRLGTYTNYVNLLGWCALALPAARTPVGLPFGVTFLAAGGADAALARWGQAWQAATALPPGRLAEPPASPPPPRWPASEPMLTLAVVGAHLRGLPLHGQLREREAVFVGEARTAPAYRLVALPGTVPPKPGLLRVGPGGASIALELWALPQRHVGSFLALIPPPLGLGSLSLDDGRIVHGFLCETEAAQGAEDISAHGGWRAYLAATVAATPR